MLKNVEKFHSLNYKYRDSDICFRKDKEKKIYYIEVKRDIATEIYEFKSFSKAINCKIVKTMYETMLSLKDLDKIYYYYDKINKIELKGLELGKDIFICP